MRLESGVTSATVVVTRPESDLIEAVFAGHVTADTVERAVTLVRTELERGAVRYFLIDTTLADGYEIQVRAPAARLLGMLLQSGAARGACIAPSSAIRMIASAVAFVVGVRMDFVLDRADGIRALARQRAEDRASTVPSSRPQSGTRPVQRVPPGEDTPPNRQK